MAKQKIEETNTWLCETKRRQCEKCAISSGKSFL